MAQATKPGRSFYDLSAQEQLVLMAQAEHAAYKAEGYVKIVAGEEEIDSAAFHESLYEVMCDAYVASKKEKFAKALTFGEVAMRTFPSHLVSQGKETELDDLGRIVWNDYVVRKVRNAVSASHTGKVQQLVGQRDDGLVLVQGEIIRKGDTLRAVYLTDNETLIFTDFTQPLKDSVRRAADKMAKNLAMVANRRPELAARAQQELSTGMESAASYASSVLSLATKSSAKTGSSKNES